MKHRTNRTNFRTAAAVTLAALTFATAACGGSDEVIDSAPEAVDAETPASDDAAEQVADTADDAPATEAPATAEEPAAEPAPAQESTPASQAAVETAEEPAAEAVETTVPPTTAPVAEEPVTEEPVAEEPVAEEPVAEEETEVVEETTTTVAEVVRQLLVDIEFSSTTARSTLRPNSPGLSVAVTRASRASDSCSTTRMAIRSPRAEPSHTPGSPPPLRSTVCAIPT